MLLNSFTGNRLIKESLLGALASGRLSHGLMLCGRKGMGVNHFAHLLAADIIGTEDVISLKEGGNPLVQIIKGEGASGLIKVDKIRQLNENVNFSSISGDKRVVIIENCENFNRSSANAILKNLEEPKDDITYILTANNPQAVLATIRSRCDVYTLSFPTRRETYAYFDSIGADRSAVDALISIYGENIGKISNALNDDKRYAILENAVTVYNAVGTGSRYEIAKCCYIYVKNKDGFKLLLEDLADICHKNLSERNVKNLGVIQKYTEILSTNAAMNLVIENFAVDMAK